ncbi:MAG TPA: hypothetical protein VGQ83_40945 [Polyangia bacterium]|jgi:hypothetical protein
MARTSFHAAWAVEAAILTTAVGLASAVYADSFHGDGSAPTPTRELELIQAVCSDAAVLEHEGKKTVGCRTCPRFLRPLATKSATQAETVYYGHFSDPAATEAMISFQGCTSRAEAEGWGVLLRKQGRAWRRVATLDRLPDCKSHTRKDGRDVLVCVDVASGGGGQAVSLSTYDALQPESKRRRILLGASFADEAWCYPHWSIAELEDVTFRDLNGDGVMDVRVTVAAARTKVPKRCESTCECKGWKPPKERQRFTFRFLATPAGFVDEAANARERLRLKRVVEVFN